MVGSSFGIIDEGALKTALLTGRDSNALPIVGLMRTVILEVWLRQVTQMTFIDQHNLKPARHTLSLVL